MRDRLPSHDSKMDWTPRPRLTIAYLTSLLTLLSSLIISDCEHCYWCLSNFISQSRQHGELGKSTVRLVVMYLYGTS